MQKDVIAVTKAAGEQAAQALGPNATASEKSAAAKQAEIDTLEGLKVAYPQLAGPIQGYIDKVNSIPTEKHTAFTADDANLQAVVRAAHGYLDGLPPVKQITIIATLQNLAASGLAALQASLGSIHGIFGNGGKAVGGPVAGGTPYLVGEKGPELFVPKASGTIVPNNKLLSGGGRAVGGGGGPTVVITGTILGGAESGRQLVRTIDQHFGSASWRQN